MVIPILLEDVISAPFDKLRVNGEHNHLFPFVPTRRATKGPPGVPRGRLTSEESGQKRPGPFKVLEEFAYAVARWVFMKSSSASAYSALGKGSPLGTFIPSVKISSRFPSGSLK